MKRMKTCDENEKDVFMSTKLEKFHENSIIEDNEKQLYRVPIVTYNEFEKSLEHDPRKLLKFGNTHQIKLMRYKRFI